MKVRGVSAGGVVAAAGAGDAGGAGFGAGATGGAAGRSGATTAAGVVGAVITGRVSVPGSARGVGVDDGTRIRLAGEGEAGRDRHLLVVV